MPQDDDLRNIIREEIQVVESKYKDRIKYFLIGLTVFVTSLILLAKFSQLDDQIIRAIIITGLEDRAAVSYEKSVELNKKVKEASLDFYSLKDQEVILRCEIYSLFSNSDQIDIAVSLDQSDVTQHFEKLFDNPNSGNRENIPLTDLLGNNIDQRTVHTLKYEYEPHTDSSARIFIKNLMVVKD